MVGSLSQAREGRVIFVGSFVQFEATLLFRKSNGLPVDQVHFSFLKSSILEKVSLGPIYELEDMHMERNILHDMIRDVAQRGLN